MHETSPPPSSPGVDAVPGTDEDPAFDGDPSWRVTRQLRDGSTVTIRPVVPEDREALRRGLMELSPESRYRRFLHGGAVPTEALLDYLTNVDQRDHVAIGATITSPDLKTERGVGIARFIRLDSRPDVAEAAVTVVDDMHHRGLGTVLLRELFRAARCRGIKRIRAEVLADNEPMRAILERAGAEKVMEDSGAGTIAWELEIDEHRPVTSPSFFDVLRVAAETMAMRLRR